MRVGGNGGGRGFSIRALLESERVLPDFDYRHGAGARNRQKRLAPGQGSGDSPRTVRQTGLPATKFAKLWWSELKPLGIIMASKPKVKKPATVRKVIKPIAPGLPEKAEIAVHDADDLYKEIRIENALEDSKGVKVKLKPGADVEVIVEADVKDTIPATDGSSDGSRGTAKDSSKK